MKLTLVRLVYWLKKDPVFKLSIILIFATGIFFRFWDYHDRIVILADSSRDAQVARYAVDYLKIPQIGQFTSAGPFFYGPWYYWMLMLFSIVPLGLLSPWYMMTLLSLTFVALIYWLGKEMGGKWVGGLAAFFASISPIQIANSLTVWNSAVIPFISLTALIFMIRYFKYKKKKDIFFLSFTVTLAVLTNFQGILITPLILLSILIGRHSLKHLGVMLLGIIVALLPLIYFDFRFNWYNFKSIFIYLAIDQYSIWVPNRWLTYIGSYWPEAWGQIIGGNKYLGGLVITLLSLFALLRLRIFKEYKILYIIAASFVAQVILYRYYRGPRYEYLTNFAHPYVLLLTAWVFNQLFKIHKVLGLLLTAILSLVTIQYSVLSLKDTQISLKKINSISEEIYKKYPSSKFNVYTCPSQEAYTPISVSQPLALDIYFDGKEANNGIKITACEKKDTITWERLPENLIESYPQIYSVSTSNVYMSTVEWWQEKPPQEDAYFWQFIKRKLNPKCYPHCL